jgi:Flp pilus assembly protein TadB
VADVEHLGSRLGLLTLVVLVVLALALWLPWRVRGVLRARRVRALAHDPRLLALKRLLGPGGAKAPARALDEVLAGGPLATELAAKEARRAGVVLGPRDHSGQ